MFSPNKGNNKITEYRGIVLYLIRPIQLSDLSFFFGEEGAGVIELPRY